MQEEFLKQTELNKTLNRFNKIRAYHNKGYNNLLPIEVLKKYAHNYQQIQLNTKFHFNAIIMDIDNPELVAEWDIAGLPVPTIQTLNKNNNKAHLVWLLQTPVNKEYKHVVDYYKAIVNSLKKLIGADAAYQNHQTKNFLNTNLYRVTYNDTAYKLGDFKKFISKGILADREHGEFDYIALGSRHIYLFETLRRYGYAIAKETNLHDMLTQKAETVNLTFKEPIKIKYIVNSVYEFCEKNKENFKQKNRNKVMKFENISNLSTHEYEVEVKRRQSCAAKRTTIIKKQKTAVKLKVAIDKLLRHKKPINIKNIAKYAKISDSTARRHLKIITVFLKNTFGFIRSIRLIVHKAQRFCTKRSVQFYRSTAIEELNTIHKLE